MTDASLARASQCHLCVVLWTLLIVGYALSTWSLKRQEQERFEPDAVPQPRRAATGRSADQQWRMPS